MATLLLVVIYIAFIGLGIPDSLFGAAWPAIYTEFNLPVSAANAVTILVFSFTMISSLISARVINTFGTSKTVAVSTALTAAGLLGYSLSGSFWFMCLFALPLGLGGGAIDAALNNYMALNYKASHMNFLHCFYGVGVTLSPYIMSIALSGGSWRAGYRAAFFIQLSITAITFVTLPLWEKVNSEKQNVSSKASAETVGILKLLKMPKVRMSGSVFMMSCGLEYTCGCWGSTFLVLSKGMPQDKAAATITFYYLGITVGRFMSGLLAAKLSSRRIILLGQAAILAALVMLFLPLPFIFAAVALFLIGFGNGPLYPNLVHLTPYNFNREISQSVMGVQMAMASIGIMVIPALFGFAAQKFGTMLFPPYLAILFVIMVVQNLRLNAAVKSESKENRL